MFNTHNIIYEKNNNLEDIYRLREYVMMFKNNPFVENKLDTTTYDTLIKACKEREHYISFKNYRNFFILIKLGNIIQIVKIFIFFRIDKIIIFSYS